MENENAILKPLSASSLICASALNQMHTLHRSLCRSMKDTLPEVQQLWLIR